MHSIQFVLEIEILLTQIITSFQCCQGKHVDAKTKARTLETKGKASTFDCSRSIWPRTPLFVLETMACGRGLGLVHHDDYTSLPYLIPHPTYSTLTLTLTSTLTPNLKINPDLNPNWTLKTFGIATFGLGAYTFRVTYLFLCCVTSYHIQIDQ